MPIRRAEPFSTPALDRLLDLQSGVVARRQLVELGADDVALRRLLRRRDLVPHHPGVYLDHSGDPTWLQRAWAAVLLCAPAALDLESALRATQGRGWRGRDDDLPIQVAIDDSRRIRSAPGCDVRRVAGLQAKVHWNLHPPRLRPEHAALDSALRADSTADTFEALARAVRGRLTTATRLLEVLSQRERVSGRSFLVDALTDLRDGNHSVLEQAYLTRVERPHALPTGTRQLREDGVHRDVAYPHLGTLVELDGVRDHTASSDRQRDLTRDLVAAASGRLTVRLGWHHVFSEPCHTARQVSEVLRQRGWSGAPQPCELECRAA